MKILGIGLGRTGTQSPAKALEILGYRAKHCPRFYLDREGKLCISEKDIQKYEALTDEPTILIYKEVDRQYPGSKFILTVRETDSWLSSVENNASALKEWRARIPAVPVLHQALYGTPTFDRSKFAGAYRKHVDEVQEYFADRKQDILVMNICAGHGWEKLCPFLNKPIPDAPFPRLNVFGESGLATLLKQGKRIQPRGGQARLDM